MKKKKTILITGLLILIAAAAVLMLSGNAHGKTLTAGVRTDIADWAVYDAEHEDCLGMEASISRYLAKKLGYSAVRFVPTDEKDGRKKLQSGDVDCLIFSFLPEDPAEDNAAYSKSYYELPTTVLARKSTLFSSLQDLSGRPVGFLSADTVPAEQLTAAMSAAGAEAPVLIPADNYHELSDMLETGEISAVCVSQDICYALLTDDCISVGSELGTQNVAVSVRKDAPDGQRILEAVNALIEDGTVNSVLDGWGWLE